MDYFLSTHTYTPPAYVRILAISSSDNSTANQDEGSDDSNNGRDAFEFVAFLLWYLFLVLCCVLPTCCAYRRRRLMEARIAEQQESFDQLHQQNVFILSNLHLRPDLDGEEARIERTQRITEALKVTTFTVAEKDITEKPDECSTGEKKPSIHVDEELGAVLDHEAMDHIALTLPSDAPNGSRTVPGGCAICLCSYETGDQVAWSREEVCKHAFHGECIIPWLAKKNEPKCPCCRQDYCIVEPVTVADLATVAPFGLIPTSLLGSTASSQILAEEGIVPTPDLVASQIVSEMFPPEQRRLSDDDDNDDDNENLQASRSVVEQQLEMTNLTVDEETGGISPSDEAVL